MEIVEEIKGIITSKLTDPSQFIVDVIVSGHKGVRKVLVIVDGDKGVTIADCANLSREFSKTFDDLPLFEDSYLLEVSTPGLDQPLKLKRQYYKNIGRKLRVVLSQKIFEGKLIEVTDEKISIDQELGSGKQKEFKTIELPFSEIEKTFVLVSFK